MDETLVCFICKQQYDEPRLLSCFHSFCTKCLIAKKISSSACSSRQTSIQDDACAASNSEYSGPEEYATEIFRPSVQKVICPECETETLLLKGGVHGLPVNFVLENKLTACKNKLPPCELCSSSVFAYARCEQCGIFMCALCVDSHMKYRDTAEHVLTHLVAAKPSSPIRKCSVHGLDLNYFCCTCVELTCFTCCTSVHSSHRYETASKASEHYSAQIVQAIEKAKPIVKNSHRSVEAIKFLENKVTSKCSDVEREIDGFIQAYKEALDEHAQGLVQQLGTIRSSRAQLLTNHQEALLQKARITQNVIEFAEELVKSSPVELLNTAPSVIDKLDITDDSDLHVLTMRVSDAVQFLPEEKASNIGKYQLFGIISTQVISPQNCTLEVEGLLSCRQHKKASFRLITKDKDNRILCHGGEKIVTELRYKDATQRLLPVTINDEGDGNYLLSFKPDTSGSLALTVMIRNVSIQGSPFNVCVSSLRPHKGVYHCCTFCSSGGSKSAKCGCGCKMPGGYKGCGHGHVGHPGRRHWSCCGNVLQNSECSRPITYQYSF